MFKCNRILIYIGELKVAPWGFRLMLTCAPVLCFYRKFFMFSLFKIIKSYQNVINKDQTTVSCTV